MYQRDHSVETNVPKKALIRARNWLLCELHAGERVHLTDLIATTMLTTQDLRDMLQHVRAAAAELRTHTSRTSCSVAPLITRDHAHCPVVGGCSCTRAGR